MSPLTSVAHPKPSLKTFLKSWTPFGHAEWGQYCSIASKSYKGKIMWFKMFSVSLLHFCVLQFLTKINPSFIYGAAGVDNKLPL